MRNAKKYKEEDPVLLFHTGLNGTHEFGPPIQLKS
jgi:hypothetical protein